MQYYFEIWGRFGVNKVFASDGYKTKKECEEAVKDVQKVLTDGKYAVICEVPDNYIILAHDF